MRHKQAVFAFINFAAVLGAIATFLEIMIPDDEDKTPCV